MNMSMLLIFFDRSEFQNRDCPRTKKNPIPGGIFLSRTSYHQGKKKEGLETFFFGQKGFSLYTLQHVQKYQSP